MSVPPEKPMTTRRECQLIWARYKYEVLSHSQQHYKQIRAYLRDGEPDKCVLLAYIREAQALPEHRGSVLNACQHVWGYFKKTATQAEKATYLSYLDAYQYGRLSQEDLWAFLKTLLVKYPNAYLSQSSLLGG